MQIFPPTVFGKYSSTPRPYSFFGMPGWWSVPAGRSWYQVIDAGMQNWASPNPITMVNGSPTGIGPIFACELNIDGTLVFQDLLANRKNNFDSPPRDRWSQIN